MAVSDRERRVVQQIIREHGPTLDLIAHPEVMVEIIRKWAFDLVEVPDGGLPGGVGPVNPPTSHVEGPQLEDVLKAILAVGRKVDKISRRLGD